MRRKPAHLEMKGGKTNRQRIWEAIRVRRSSFDQLQLAADVGGLERIVEEYVRSLLRAGYIAVIPDERAGLVGTRRTYRLVRDNGVEAPRLTKSGEPVLASTGNEAMWGTMHRMFERKDFNYRELVAFASTEANPISEETARHYVTALAQAGYLRVTRQAMRGANAAPARYVLIASKFSGPRPPMIQNTKALYDPNQGRVVWVDTRRFEDGE
ncbi:hypothetical protein ACKI2N_002400 [Cupriavidus sp. 30B13]|uniref:hypothetical protein n=1 Tax=Cupriavidus sp. 30B13 TaxID=3384241 RepID=UPI003B914514